MLINQDHLRRSQSGWEDAWIGSDLPSYLGAHALVDSSGERIQFLPQQTGGSNVPG